MRIPREAFGRFLVVIGVITGLSLAPATAIAETPKVVHFALDSERDASTLTGDIAFSEPNAKVFLRMRFDGVAMPPCAMVHVTAHNDTGHVLDVQARRLKVDTSCDRGTELVEAFTMTTTPEGRSIRTVLIAFEVGGPSLGFSTDAGPVVAAAVCTRLGCHAF